MSRLEEIRSVLREERERIRERFRAEVVGVFGSYARGEQGPHSDVDLLVRFLPGATLFDLARLGDDLEERLGVPVDIVPVDAVREEIREEVFREAVFL